MLYVLCSIGLVYLLLCYSVYFVAACLQKADKEQLDAKVNCDHFDATCEELKQMISNTLNKLLRCVRRASD